MSAARVSLRGIVVRRGGRTVLDVPALDLLPGEVLAVIGPNGSGKSTLVQTVALLERPHAGTVLFDGVSVRGREQETRRRMAVVFQEPLLLDRSVRDNITLGLQLRGVPRAQRAERAVTWMELLGIAHLARRRAHQLSGGEAQRASLARALALNPDVLLLDEPFTGLDSPTRARLVTDLAALLTETRPATLFVTHDRDEAQGLAGRAAVLVGGRLRQAGTIDDVFSRPADVDVAALVGVETVVRGRVLERAGGKLCVVVGEAKIWAESSVAASDVWVCLRPDDVRCVPAEREPSPGENRLVGRVIAVTPAGGQRRVTVDCGFPLVTLTSRGIVDEQRITPRAAVTVAFAPSSVHLIAVTDGAP